MSIRKYAQLPLDVQRAITTNAGLILSDFDPDKNYTAEEIKKAILYATTGGVDISCAAILRDAGRDVDHCPKNTKELMEIEAWECKLRGTALTVTADIAAMQLGSADRNETTAGVTVVTPRMKVKNEDFKTLWYVCAYGTAGGFVAVKLKNVWNEGGFSMHAEDGKKGGFAFSYVGHTSLDAPDEVPFTFYLKENDASSASLLSLNVK